ncbi:MAG: DNA-deoxyinosine glycosylase [Holosporales bacterium]|jgi:hypoxanthine-DNA glycosylase|nr:DNA-deoxyinosine glycosylase [Holosporales bacterium]
MKNLSHPFEPVYDKDSEILILGSFPSEKSREYGFYYGHPQNRFWKILVYLTKTEQIPISIDDKKHMLFKNKIALWDVIKSCSIISSSDSNITNVVPTDLFIILSHSNIKQIFANGDKAYKLYKKYCSEHISIEITKLPSTSPANATYSFERLVEKWSVIMPYILVNWHIMRGHF